MQILIISIPLLSSFSIYFLGRYIGHKGGKIIAIISIFSSVLISLLSLKEYIQGKITYINIKNWFEVGQLISQFDLIYDKQSIIMSNLISLITFVVIVYSYWYLGEDPHLNRFISKLLLFSVSMFILVSSKNFIFSFFGWELVGVVSYLLINFWYLSIQNNKCAIKAIIFNKIGDIFYLLALLILALTFYSFDYLYINSFVSNNYNPFLYTILIFLFLFAAMAKSAQIFLHCWLGDAMAGPTPVSALLHAATMVTAGIFLVLRCENLLDYSLPIVKDFINIIGTLTILFAGISALNQNDIKKVIAYSTCAQIGYMFFALSLFKPLEGSIYHLVTHGFFKALLFLSAGLLIHSFMLEQDLRKFGNFIFVAPLFYIFFFIGSLAIIGFPPLSGFFSKDLIVLHSLEYSSYSFIILIIGSLLSSLYSFKILYYAFFNNNNNSFFSFHSLSSPKNTLLQLITNYSFLFPFIIIIFGSLFLGFISSSFFSSFETLNLDLELYINSYSTPINLLNTNSFNLPLIPFLLPFIAILSLFIYYKYFSLIQFSKYLFFNELFLSFYSFFNKKFLFDSFYNYFISKPFFIISYHFTYKFIDRGYLEYLGPVALFRLIFFFSNHYNLSSQYISNLPYLIFYLFISFFFILIFFFLFLPFNPFYLNLL